MSFKEHQYEFNKGGFVSVQSCQRSVVQARQTKYIQDIPQKIKNSICYILEICDEQNLHRTTKFMAYSLFLRYINFHKLASDEQLSLLILCCLRLAAKFNEAFPKSGLFDQPSYSNLLTSNLDGSDILQFQTFLFCQINFKINIKSPYQYLEEMVHNRNLPSNFYHTINAYIDFALTLIQLRDCNSEQIFAGCLYALKNSRKIKNKKIVGLIQEVCARVNTSDKVGYIIMAIWTQIVEVQQQ